MLYATTKRRRRLSIIELGSGGSTLVLASVLPRVLEDLDITSIEGDESYARQAQDMLHLHELDNNAKVSWYVHAIQQYWVVQQARTRTSYERKEGRHSHSGCATGNVVPMRATTRNSVLLALFEATRFGDASRRVATRRVAYHPEMETVPSMFHIKSTRLVDSLSLSGATFSARITSRPPRIRRSRRHSAYDLLLTPSPSLPKKPPCRHSS